MVRLAGVLLFLPALVVAAGPGLPPDWPVLAGMSGTCAEVQGTFADPNTWHWAREDKATGSKYGGTREAAWSAFGFAPAEVRPEDARAGTRSVTLAIDADQVLSVTYRLGSEVAATRRFARAAWSCGAEGLVVTVSDRSGAVLDKLPNQGRAVQRVTLYRMQGPLYVKVVHETRAKTLGVVPQSFVSVVWMRLPPSGP